MATLVVGVDGSAESLAALSWAVSLAGAEATVVAVEVVPGDVATPLWAEAARSAGAGEVRQTAGDEVSNGLLSVADELHADGVVVGAHRGEGGGTRSLGRATAHLVRHATRPVLVHRTASERSDEDDGPATVAVGVGDGAATEAALRWAATQAVARGLHLRLVRAVGRPSLRRPDSVFDLLARTIDPAAPRQLAESDLSALAAELRRESGGALSVDWEADTGGAAAGLVRATADADLLVVGRHAGRLTERLVSPSLHHVLTHANCPVVVVPAAVTDAG